MREENSPSIGEGKREELREEYFPEIGEFMELNFYLEIPFSRKERKEFYYSSPHSLREMKKFEEFYLEILSWRNFHSSGMEWEEFLFPPEGMNEEIYEEIHRGILQEGIPYIEFIQEYIHSFGKELKEFEFQREEFKEEYRIWKREEYSE